MELSTLVWDGDRAPFAKAFVAAQKATESVKKAATNPAFKTKYADLSQVVEGVIPALNGAGVGVLQFPSYDGELVGVATTFLHESGSSVTATLHLRPSKSDPQGVGSAITYARRYSLLAMTGAAPEDDDGNAASGPRARSENAPSAEDAAINLLRGASADKGLFKEAWERNKGNWQKFLDPDAYARVVAAMKSIAKTLADPEPPQQRQPNRASESIGALIGADEIPF